MTFWLLHLQSGSPVPTAHEMKHKSSTSPSLSLIPPAPVAAASICAVLLVPASCPAPNHCPPSSTVRVRLDAWTPEGWRLEIDRLKIGPVPSPSALSALSPPLHRR